MRTKRRMSREFEMPRMSVILFFFWITGAAVYGQEMSSDELLEKAEKIIAPEEYYSKIKIVTKGPSSRDKTMIIESFCKKGTGTFIEILSPERFKGIRFLKNEENLWMFNPRSNSKSAIRLSPRESFQGTVFSNSNFGDPHYTDDYDTAYGDDETIEHPGLGRTDCYTIICTPKHPEATYGKIKMWIRKKDSVPLKLFFYAKSGLLFKRLTLSEIKQLAGMKRPTKYTMKSGVQKERSSIMSILEMELRENIPDRKFDQQAFTQ